MEQAHLHLEYVVELAFEDPLADFGFELSNDCLFGFQQPFVDFEGDVVEEVYIKVLLFLNEEAAKGGFLFHVGFDIGVVLFL